MNTRIFTVMAVLWAVPADAKTLYVNPTHASDTDATTYANNSATAPWTTVGRAVWGSGNVNSPQSAEAARGGDLVLVLAGGSPYTSAQANADPHRYLPLYNPVNEGGSTARMTIRCVASFAAPTVVSVGGCDLRASAHRGPVLGFYQRDYVTWDGFKVDEHFTTSTPDTGPVVAWEMTGGELLNGIIIGITTSFNDNHAGIRLERANGVVIRNWSISGIKDVQMGENPAGIMLYESSNVIIEGSTATGGSNGIFVKGNNPGPVTIRRNLIHTQGRGIYAAGIDAPNGAAQRLLISENILYGLQNGIVFVSYDAESPVHVLICNNTLRATTNALDTPIRFAANQIAGLNHVRIVGNIVVDGYNAIGGEDQDGAAFAAKAGPDQSALEIESNVYHGFTNAFSRIAYTNRTFAAWKTFTGTDQAGPASREADPLFMNKAGHDYRLNTGSPARMAVPDVCDIDRDGNTTETKDAGARQFSDNAAPVAIGFGGATTTPPPITPPDPPTTPVLRTTLCTVEVTTQAVGGQVTSMRIVPPCPPAARTPGK